MKKFRYTILSVGVVLSLLSIGSCTQLEDGNYSTIVAEDFNPTDEDVAALIGSGYTAWRQTLLFWNGVWRSQEVTADEIVIPARPNGWVDGGIYKRMHQHNWYPEDDNVYQGWYRTYEGVTNCNKLIYQVDTGYIPMDEETKNATLAELRVLRASYFYILMDLYGNVPLSIDWEVEEGYLPQQNTRQEVYDFVIKEITESLDDLSESNSKEMYGRFNKWAAYTLLAKIYLNAEVYTGTARWAECIEACDEVINAGVYSLESNQKNVFITENENSPEIIFGLAIDGSYTTAWNQFDIHMQTLQPSNQATYELTQTPWGGMCAIPQFIDTFDPDDSRLTDNFIYGQQYTSTGDMIYCTMGAFTGQPLAYINEVPSVDQSEEIHGYRFGKFEIAKGSNNILSNDYPVLRYADVIMMKAEGLLRTGNADAAASLVTEVRQRAFAANPSKAEVTGAELMEGSSYDYGLRTVDQSSNEGGADIQYGRFLDELAWEFNQEGRRRQDMIRFGVFANKSWFSHNAGSTGEYREIYPIPFGALQTNGNLTQNPGY
ncbi:RagB/SusD family nutrient uptake outer membrane protein [Robertkochia solimangrovi]|uniref:RagB/SusD family nutrient uptake outer membrane protein n=1 Tax=Robertkochia solimangrovi TaxID=2213046 RepID=UPI00117CE917|nr:RagB/SusD family nutrient uptake outer membrane protein [Robertkochia solimangrovi]TRZ45912.1 RagB/SusD family nutrient uptake outer membrane protein [Robertkochia solimangrovi]